MGTPQEVRFRTRAKIGNDPLNYTQHRFSATVTDTHCPFCPAIDETVDHFLCKCPAYRQQRSNLYRTFREIYPFPSLEFNHIGLLHEPTTKAAIITHLPVIEALNTFTTEALQIRKTREFLVL